MRGQRFRGASQSNRCWCAVVLAGTLLAAAGNAFAYELAVLDFPRPDNVPAQFVEHLEEEVRFHAQQYMGGAGGWTVLSAQTMQHRLRQKDWDEGLCVGEKCPIEKGLALEVSLVVTGSITLTESHYRLILQTLRIPAGEAPASARATGTSHDELLCELEAACAYIFAGEERDSSACDSYRSLPSDASAGNELEVIPSDSVHGVAAIEQGIPVTPPPPEPEPIEDRTGILWVEVNPPEATIFVDGRRAGQGRAQKTLPVGPHTVRAELGELYHPSEQAVSLSKDGLTVALTLAPAFGSLWVRSEPPGAEVWLAGEPVGNTPWLVERKKSGTYSIQLSLPPRFQPHFGEVTVEDGEETSLDVVLEGNGASLLVSSEPPGANIRLAGLDTEETTPHEFAFVPAGIVEVRLALEGYREAVLLPTITAGKKALARVTLEPIPGILVILTRELGNGPCHCGAFVDGEAVGETPIKLQLPATKHRIRVDCGGREEEETVTLLPGDQVEVLIELPPRATAENDARTGIQWVQISELPESATGGSAEGREQRPFVVSRSEVTVGQYRRCVDAGGCSPPADISRMCNGLEESRDQHPVNCVTWSQAKMYAQWANAALLPGDLWALAARGGGGALLETDVFDLVEGGDAVHFHQGQARSDVGFRVYRWIDPAP